MGNIFEHKERARGVTEISYVTSASDFLVLICIDNRCKNLTTVVVKYSLDENVMGKCI